jgi:hypothetical protein
MLPKNQIENDNPHVEGYPPSKPDLGGNLFDNSQPQIPVPQSDTKSKYNHFLVR